MSDQRSAIAEFRELEQRRLAGGLTSAEVARYDWLRRVVGTQAPPAPGSGFDMGAAAGDLRDSLLPAGLRDRSMTPPAGSEGDFWDELPGQPAPASAPPSSPFPEGGLDASWLSEEEPLAAPPAVKPQAWNPAAPGYDPNAPYDEAAWIAAGYDPNVVYDWSAYGADAAQASEPPPPGQVVTAPAIPIPALAVPAGPAPEPEPAEEDLPTLDVLSPEELPQAEPTGPARGDLAALEPFPPTDALLAPAPVAAAPPPPAPSAPAALVDDDGWPGFEPDAAPAPTSVPAPVSQPAPEAPTFDQAIPVPALELLEPGEPLAAVVEASPAPAPVEAEVEAAAAVVAAPAPAFDDLLSDDELELLASGGGMLEAAPPAPPTEAAPEEPVSLDLLEAPPEEVELPALGLDPVQGVLPEPLLEPPAEPASDAGPDPLHPPLPEAVRANVFVPPAPIFAPPARPLAAASLHPPLPEPVRANVFVPPAPIFAPPAWAIPSGPPAPEPAPELLSPMPEAAEPVSPEPMAPEPVTASVPEAPAAPPLPLEPPALPPIELSPIELPPIELPSIEDVPPAAAPPPALLAEPAAAPPEAVQPAAAAPEPLPTPEAGFGAYDELASGGPRFVLGAPPVEPMSGAWDAGGEPLLDPAIQPYQPAPPGTPLGEYDEQPAGGGRGLESMLPFDPAAAVAIPVGSVPEGYQAPPPEPEEQSISLELELPGTLDGPSLSPATVPPVAELSEVSADWQPEGALDHGFELAGDGSFGLPELSLGDTPTWPPPAPPSPPPFALDPPGHRVPEAAPLAAPAPTPAASPAPTSPPDETLFPADEVEEVLEVMGPGEEAEEALPALELHPTPPAPPPASVFVAPAAGLFAAALTPPPGRPLPAPAPGPAIAPPPPASVFVPPAAELFGRPPPPAMTPPPRPRPAIDLDLEEEPPRPPAIGRGASRPPAITPAPFVQAVPAAPSEQLPPPVAPPVAPAAPARPAPAAPVVARLKPPAPAAGPHGLAAPPVLASPPAPARPAPAVPVVPAPPPAADAGTELESLPPLLPGTRFEGTHRVLVHTVDGEVKRGVLESPVMDGDRLTLLPQGTGAPQVLETSGVKAVFFLLAAGERPPAPEGRKVRVTFRDGRQVLGASPDYQEGQVGFLLIPVEAKTTTARIWVYQASVRQVLIG